MRINKIGTGCGVIILKDNKILMGLRNVNVDTADCESHEEGTWSLPGGNMEYGETFFQAGAREVKEETGLDAEELEVFCVQNDLNEYAHYVSVGMICHKFSGLERVMEPDEIICWEWFDIDNLPTNIFKASQKTIECFLKKTFYLP